jgi:hypothetical protein
MNLVIQQRSRRSALHLFHDLLDGMPVPRNDQMHVIAHDRTGMDDNATACHELCKPRPNRTDATIVETNRRMREGSLGGESGASIVLAPGERPALVGLRRPSERLQSLRLHVLRPGPARIVRQPEPVGAEDDVRSEDHVETH